MNSDEVGFESTFLKLLEPRTRLGQWFCLATPGEKKIGVK